MPIMKGVLGSYKAVTDPSQIRHQHLPLSISSSRRDCTQIQPKASGHTSKSNTLNQLMQIRSDSSSDSDQEEAEIDNSSSSDSGSDAAVESKPRKRARIKDSPKARVKKEPPKGKAKELSGARVFILDKLANLVKKLFGDAEVDASGYAAELEESLFEHFKEGQGVGGRYK